MNGMELENTSVTIKCDKEENTQKETSIAYDNKGKEKTSCV